MDIVGACYDVCRVPLGRIACCESCDVRGGNGKCILFFIGDLYVESKQRR